MKLLDRYFIVCDLRDEHLTKLAALTPQAWRNGYVYQGNRRGARKVRRALREWHWRCLLGLYHRRFQALVLERDVILTRQAFLTALVAPGVLARSGGAR